MKNLGKYIILADLFEYPDAHFPARVQKVQDFLDENHPEEGQTLKPFTEFCKKATMVEMEELYTRSFDVQALTTLDIGYILFGDDYKRGEMLVNLNREHRDAGTRFLNTELSDHLPNVLRLLPRMTDAVVRDEFAERMVGPAVMRMINDFDSRRIELKNKVYQKHHKTIIDSPADIARLYRGVLEALFRLLSIDFNIQKEEKDKSKSSSFLKSLNTEMELEKE